MIIDVCVAGALGVVGRTIVSAVLQRPDAFRLVSAFARKGSGEDVGSVVTGQPCGVTLTSSIDAALAARPQVLIDYTHPSVVEAHIQAAFAMGVSVVIGTTGFVDADFHRIDRAAREANLGCVTGNFSFTAALLQHLAKVAARHIPSWEIVEYARAEKPDVPSGTARELAELLGAIREPKVQLRSDQLHGPTEARGAKFGGAHVHSVRLPGFSAAIEIIFGLKGERLIMRHEEHDRSIYVEGSLLAAQRVRSARGLVRGLDALLFEQGA